MVWIKNVEVTLIKNVKGTWIKKCGGLHPLYEKIKIGKELVLYELCF